MPKSPAFQFYPKDWLSSRRVRLMTAEQRGWYIQLICEAWESEVQGTLPYDMDVLWVLAGSPNQQAFNDRSTPVLAMFELKDNVLIHHRLISELVKQAEFKEHCSQAGKRSAELRRQALKEKHLNGRSTPVQRTFNAGSISVPTEVQPTPQPKVNSSSSSSSSSSYKEVLDYLNLKTGKKFQAVDGNIKFIAARLKEGFPVEILKSVIDVRCKKWLNDPKWSDYLRPSTLFNAEKFAAYSGEVGAEIAQKTSQEYSSTDYLREMEKQEYLKKAQKDKEVL